MRVTNILLSRGSANNPTGRGWMVRHPATTFEPPSTQHAPPFAKRSAPARVGAAQSLPLGRASQSQKPSPPNAMPQKQLRSLFPFGYIFDGVKDDFE